MANTMNDTERELTEQICTVVSNMTEEEKKRILWIGEGIIFAKQIKENE